MVSLLTACEHTTGGPCEQVRRFWSDRYPADCYRVYLQASLKLVCHEQFSSYDQIRSGKPECHRNAPEHALPSPGLFPVQQERLGEKRVIVSWRAGTVGLP